MILTGVGVCLAGLPSLAWRHVEKEREMPEQQKKAAIKEFDFKKPSWRRSPASSGASFSYGLTPGGPIKQITTLQHGTTELWQGLPVLVVVLLGGFTTNFIWCALLNIKNKTGYQYFSASVRDRFPAASRKPLSRLP